MSDFKDLLDYCKIKSILDKLEPNEVSVWESMCRSYSIRFHTPLHKVMELSPEFVMNQEFSSQMEDFDLEKDVEELLELIKSIEDPDYELEKNKEFDEFIADAEEEERERIKLGKPVHKSIKNEPSLKPKEELKKSGFVNFERLAALEAREESEGGFDD